MKNISFVLLTSAALTACAPTYERLRAKAQENSNDELCMVQIVKPEYAHVARDELASRGASCDWERTRMQAQAYVQQRQANEAASAAYLGAAAQILSNSGPRPLGPPPTMTSCRSVYQGSGVVQTNCF